MASRFTARVKETPQSEQYRLDLIAGLTHELIPLKSVDAAIEALPPSSKVSVTCSPVKGIDTTIELTDRIRAAGHMAIPHISARMVEDADHVARIAAWLRTEDVGTMFLVGGDADPPGAYPDAISFLRDLLDADPGLRTIGVTAYPDSHPLIDTDVLHEALHAKQALLAEAGVAGYASTQMCFDSGKIVSWLERERAAGLTLPIHLGVAGVVDRSKLMTMGVRLGIGSSLRYLKKNRNAIGRLLTSASFDPNKLLVPLSPHLEPLAVEGLHCFTFNQVDATVSWQKRVLES
ncbi:MAG: hypothetical protein AAF467_13295 [Actinomycetota bacterium]